MLTLTSLYSGIHVRIERFYYEYTSFFIATEIMYRISQLLPV